MEKDKQRRFKCICAYDGTSYSGWQSQPNGLGVQDFIERRLRTIFGREVRIHGSGRTDAGVHARAQVFHFDAVWNHSMDALAAALRSGHNREIQIRSVSVAEEGFHARFSAKGKRYVYKIYAGYAPPDITRYVWSLGNRHPDVDLMNEASALMIGRRDFAAFGANRRDGKMHDTVKDLRVLRITKKGRMLTLTTEGSGYLYRMVRLMTGALVAVGLGKITKSDIQKALETKERGNLFAAAPAQGLTLFKVFY